MELLGYDREEVNVIYFVSQEANAILTHIVPRPSNLVLVAAQPAPSFCLHPQSVQLQRPCPCSGSPPAGSARDCKVLLHLIQHFHTISLDFLKCIPFISSGEVYSS